MARNFYSIANCEFAFQCPKAWERLEATAVEGERHCIACQRTVYLCTDDAALAIHVKAGHCVAVEDVMKGGVSMGQVSPEYPAPTVEEPDAIQKATWLKIAPGLLNTKADPNGKINWD